MISNPSDYPSVEELRRDAERLVAHAAEQEHRLSGLAMRIARDGHTAIAASTRIAASAASHVDISLPSELTRSASVFDEVRELSALARQQRQLADSILLRLGSDRRYITPALQVLVVDDDGDNREVMAAMLDASGFYTVMASNGLEGLIAAHAVRPAIVLMDVTMPVLSGIEAARLLKASDVTRDVKVIAHTARPELLDDRVAGLFVEILKKPVRADAVVAAIERHFPRAAAMPK